MVLATSFPVCGGIASQFCGAVPIHRNPTTASTTWSMGTLRLCTTLYERMNERSWQGSRGATNKKKLAEVLCTEVLCTVCVYCVCCRCIVDMHRYASICVNMQRTSALPLPLFLSQPLTINNAIDSVVSYHVMHGSDTANYNAIAPLSHCLFAKLAGR